jgi:hypothetical protein
MLEAENHLGLSVLAFRLWRPRLRRKMIRGINLAAIVTDDRS